MEIKDGDIIRYALVAFAAYKPVWYYDELDEVEVDDMVIVPYGIREMDGQVLQVVRCVYPHVVYDFKKTKPIYEVTKKAALATK